MSIFILLLRIFDVVQQLGPCKTSQQDRLEIKKFWNLQPLKYINHNDAKMTDIWNVNKLTA